MRVPDYGYGLKFETPGFGLPGLSFLAPILSSLFGFGGGSSSSSSSDNTNQNSPMLFGQVEQNNPILEGPGGSSINLQPQVAMTDANARAGGGFSLFGGGSSSSSASANTNQNENIAQANPNNLQTMINQTFYPNPEPAAAAQALGQVGSNPGFIPPGFPNLRYLKAGDFVPIPGYNTPGNMSPSGFRSPGAVLAGGGGPSMAPLLGGSPGGGNPPEQPWNYGAPEGGGGGSGLPSDISPGIKQMFDAASSALSAARAGGGGPSIPSPSGSFPLSAVTQSTNTNPDRGPVFVASAGTGAGPGGGGGPLKVPPAPAGGMAFAFPPGVTMPTAEQFAAYANAMNPQANSTATAKAYKTSPEQMQKDYAQALVDLHSDANTTYDPVLNRAQGNIDRVQGEIAKTENILASLANQAGSTEFNRQVAGRNASRAVYASRPSFGGALYHQLVRGEVPIEDSARIAGLATLEYGQDVAGRAAQTGVYEKILESQQAQLKGYEEAYDKALKDKGEFIAHGASGLRGMYGTMAQFEKGLSSMEVGDRLAGVKAVGNAVNAVNNAQRNYNYGERTTEMGTAAANRNTTAQETNRIRERGVDIAQQKADTASDALASENAWRSSMWGINAERAESGRMAAAGQLGQAAALAPPGSPLRDALTGAATRGLSAGPAGSLNGAPVTAPLRPFVPPVRTAPQRKPVAPQQTQAQAPNQTRPVAAEADAATREMQADLMEGLSMGFTWDQAIERLNTAWLNHGYRFNKQTKRAEPLIAQ